MSVRLGPVGRCAPPGGELVARVVSPLAHRLARCQQLPSRPVGETVGAHRSKHVVRGPQPLARFDSPVLPTEPLTVEQMGAGRGPDAAGYGPTDRSPRDPGPRPPRPRSARPASAPRSLSRPGSRAQATPRPSPTSWNSSSAPLAAASTDRSSGCTEAPRERGSSEWCRVHDPVPAIATRLVRLLNQLARQS